MPRHLPPGLPPDLYKCGGSGWGDRVGGVTFGGWDFSLAFARCCFCIAANLLVFTTPIRIPSCRQLYHTIRRRSYSRIYINAGMDIPWYEARAGAAGGGSEGAGDFRRTGFQTRLSAQTHAYIWTAIRPHRIFTGPVPETASFFSLPPHP